MSERIKSAVSIDWSQQQKSLSNQSVSYLEKGLKGFAGGIKKMVYHVPPPQKI